MKDKIKDLGEKVRSMIEDARMYIQDTSVIINAGLEPSYEVRNKEWTKKLSRIEGLNVSGFKEKFFDFMQKYGIFDVYSAYGEKKNRNTYTSLIKSARFLEYMSKKYGIPQQTSKPYNNIEPDRQRSYREINGNTGYLSCRIDDSLAGNN